MAVKLYDKESPHQPDFIGGGLISTDTNHNMVHRYGMYSVTYYNLSVADSGTVTIGLNIPTGFEMHVKEYSILGDDFPWILDSVNFTTYTESGNFLTPMNHHISETSHPSRVIVNLNPTDLPAEGDYKLLFGGGASLGQSTNSGGFSANIEYILHAGKHIVRATNNTGGVQEFSIVITWYEIDLT